MQPVQVNGSENVGNSRSGDIELVQQLYLSPGYAYVHFQLGGDRDEVLLQNLQRDDTCTCAAMFRDQLQGPSLLRGNPSVVGVDEYICIEEATSAHGSRRD